MFPLRYTDFSKSSMANPMENFPSGRKLFADPAAGGDCFLAPMSSLRYIAGLDFFSKSQRVSPMGNFSIGELFFGPIADAAKFFRALPCFHSDTLIFF